MVRRVNLSRVIRGERDVSHGDPHDRQKFSCCFCPSIPAKKRIRWVPHPCEAFVARVRKHEHQPSRAIRKFSCCSCPSIPAKKRTKWVPHPCEAFVARVGKHKRPSVRRPTLPQANNLQEHSAEPRCLHQHSGSDGDERWALNTARRANQRDRAAETTCAQKALRLPSARLNSPWEARHV